MQAFNQLFWGVVEKNTKPSFGNHGNILQKSRRKPSEITATSSRNHRDFLRKSRQLLQEITATFATFLRDF